MAPGILDFHRREKSRRPASGLRGVPPHRPAVQRLAPPLERIFRSKGIRREALASLRLFCDAARRETATLELARKARADVERGT